MQQINQQDLQNPQDKRAVDVHIYNPQQPEPYRTRFLDPVKTRKFLVIQKEIFEEEITTETPSIHEGEVARIASLWRDLSLELRDYLWLTETNVKFRNLEAAIISYSIYLAGLRKMKLHPRNVMEAAADFLLKEMRSKRTNAKQWRNKRRMLQEAAHLMQEQMTVNINSKILISIQNQFEAQSILAVAIKILNYAKEKKEYYEMKEYPLYIVDVVRSTRQDGLQAIEEYLDKLYFKRTKSVKKREMKQESKLQSIARYQRESSEEN